MLLCAGGSTESKEFPGSLSCRGFSRRVHERKMAFGLKDQARQKFPL
jgi:hypothetical protein